MREEDKGVGNDEAWQERLEAVEPPALRREDIEAEVRREFPALEPLLEMDRALYRAVNGLPHPPQVMRGLHQLSSLLTGGHAWFLVPVLVGVLGRDGARAKAIFLDLLPAVWLGTSAVEYGLKRMFRRARPWAVPDRDTEFEPVVYGNRPTSYSFPSGHSAAAFAGPAAMSRHLRPLEKIMVYGVALTVAFSRTYLGKHYPVDVVAGSLCGWVMAKIARRIFR